MIEATRLNGKKVYINPHLIESIEVIENNPDTRISFITGKLLVVKDSAPQILDKIVEYRNKIGLNVETTKRID